MSEAEELAWLRDWRSRVVSAHRIWWKPRSYEAACEAWGRIVSILKEKAPGE